MKKLLFAMVVAAVGAAFGDYGYLYWAVDQGAAASPIEFAYAQIKTSDGSWKSGCLDAPNGSATAAGPVNAALGDNDLRGRQFVVQLLNDAYDVVGVTDAIEYAALSEHIFDGMSEAGATPYLATEFTAVVPGDPEGSKGNPWEIGGGVTAWVDPALKNLAAVVIDNGLPGATNVIDLVALTNKMATGGFEPSAGSFNALVAVEKGDGGTSYAKPANWLDADDAAGRRVYDTLADALAAGVTNVVPNFFTKEAEVPAEIVETVTGGDGKTYTVVLENTQPEQGSTVENPVKVTAIEGLGEVATQLNTNVTLKVGAKDAASVDPNVAAAVSNALEKVSAGGFDSVAFVDLSILFDEAAQENCELGTLIKLHIPWSVRTGGSYGVVRMHNCEAQVIPRGEAKAVDGEYFEVDVEKREFVLCIGKFSDYAIAEASSLKVGDNATATVKDGICTISGEGSVTGFPSGFDCASISNVVVESGITEIGNAVFANCPTSELAEILFKNPAAVINIGAFVGDGGAKTNVPTVKVETVAKDGQVRRVVPVGFRDVADRRRVYPTLQTAIDAAALAVTPRIRSDVMIIFR